MSVVVEGPTSSSEIAKEGKIYKGKDIAPVLGGIKIGNRKLWFPVSPWISWSSAGGSRGGGGGRSGDEPKCHAHRCREWGLEIRVWEFALHSNSLFSGCKV